MKYKNNNIKFISYILIFIFIFTYPVMASYKDEVGTHIKDAINAPDIEIITTGAKYNPLTIATQNINGGYVGQFSPNEEVKFIVDAKTFNVKCNNAFIVAEVYNQNDEFVKALSKGYGVIKPSQYRKAVLNYKLPNNAGVGVWNMAGYWWCNDVSITDINKDGIIGKGEIISQTYKTSISVIKTGSKGCNEGYVGVETCRSSGQSNSGNNQDVYKLFKHETCNSEYKKVESCGNTQGCFAGECKNVDIDFCGDGSCTGKENYLNCVSDCGGLDPCKDTNCEGTSVINETKNKDKVMNIIYLILLIGGIYIINKMWF